MIHLRAARRAALRAKLNIDGSAAADCAAVTVCGPCALAQEAREIKYSFVPVPVEHAALLTSPRSPSQRPWWSASESESSQQSLALADGSRDSTQQIVGRSFSAREGADT